MCVISSPESLDVGWPILLHFPSPELYLVYNTEETFKSLGVPFQSQGRAIKFSKWAKILLLYVPHSTVESHLPDHTSRET